MARAPTKHQASGPRRPAPPAPPDFPHVDLADRYAADVVSGAILACKWVRLACERYQRDRSRDQDSTWPYRFDPGKAERACRFVELMPHTKGRWAQKGERLILSGWQAWILVNVFGFVRKKDGLRRFREALVVVPRKNGKALALDTAVPTPTGWTTMGELEVGCEVLGANGEVRTVTAVTDAMHDRLCYKLRTRDGEEIVADDGHLWLTDSRADRDRLKGRGGKTAGPKPSIKTTGQIARTLKCRGEVNHRILLPRPMSLPERDLPVHPYTLGAWLGDGSTACARITIGDYDAAEMCRIFAEIGQPIQRRHGFGVVSLVVV